MELSPYRKHKIYLAVIMQFGLGSDDPEEISLYSKIKSELNDDKKKGYMGIHRED